MHRRMPVRTGRHRLPEERQPSMPDTPAWVRDAIFYQVFPDRFASSDRVPKPGPMEPWDSPPTLHGFKGGDLLGVAEHLDHIVATGANALYLTPSFQSASNHRYHTYDYFRIDPLLGGNDALRELLDRAHERGMRVILDGVFNHTGRGFWPFHHVLENGAASPYRRWFHFDQAGLDRGLPIDAYPAAHQRAGVAADQPHPGQVEVGRGGSKARLGYEAWWDLPALPKLNVAEPAVREYLWQVAEHWIRFGADGWRLDVPAEIDDPAFWEEFRRRVRGANAEAYLVGEIWYVAPDWVRGDRFDALMNYPLAKAIIGFVAGRSLNEALLRSHHEYAQIQRLDGPGFDRAVGELLGAYDPATNEVQLNLLDSHDTPRVLSILGGDREAYELAVLLQATLPGAPCVYYGDEVGLQGGLDPDSRRSFPWDERRWDRALFDYVGAAFRVRQAEQGLRRGRTDGLLAEGPVIAFERRDASGRIGIAINTGAASATVPVARDVAASTPLATLLVAGAARAAGDLPASRRDDGSAVVELPGRSGVVVRTS
jgi:cyclomaltodextrinase / maltogenic alpha-amylase / neopullulanase